MVWAISGPAISAHRDARMVSGETAHDSGAAECNALQSRTFAPWRTGMEASHFSGVQCVAVRPRPPLLCSLAHGAVRDPSRFGFGGVQCFAVQSVRRAAPTEAVQNLRSFAHRHGDRPHLPNAMRCSPEGKCLTRQGRRRVPAPHIPLLLSTPMILLLTLVNEMHRDQLSGHWRTIRLRRHRPFPSGAEWGPAMKTSPASDRS